MLLLGPSQLHLFALVALAAGAIWAGANLLDARALWRTHDAGAALRAASALVVGVFSALAAATAHWAASVLEPFVADPQALRALGGYAGLALVPTFVLAGGAYFSVWRRLTDA